LPPCPPLREIRTTLDDFCNTKYDARAHREPLDPCYRECPRAPPSTLVPVRRRAPRAGRRVREIAPSAPSGSGSVERGRHRRSGSVTSSTNPVHLLSRCPCGPEVEDSSCCPGAPRSGFVALSRKRAIPREPRCIPPSGPGYVRRDCSRSSAPCGLPLLVCRPLRREGSRDGRTDASFDPGLAFTLDGWRRWSGLVSSAPG